MLHRIEICDIPGRKTLGNRMVVEEIQEFLRSEFPAAEVEIKGHYKTTASAYSAYKNAVNTAKVAVTVLTRGDRLFLIRDVGRSDK